MNKPYPGYSPNYKEISYVGGLHRNCLIIDILSLDKLQPAEIAMLEEQLSAALTKITKNMHNIEKCDLITPDRFDRILKSGLRLQ